MGSVKALINHAHEGKIISKNENRILLKEGESTGKVHKRSPKCKVVVIPSFLALVEALSVCAFVAEGVGEGASIPLKGFFTLLFPALQQKYRHLMANLGAEFQFILNPNSSPQSINHK